MKFFAVVKHEYKKVVLKWSFLISTILLPVLALCFAFVPALIFSIKGEPTKIIIADLNGSIEARLKENLSPEKAQAEQKKAAEDALKNIGSKDNANQSAQFLNSEFIITSYNAGDKDFDTVKTELNSQIVSGSSDAYLIIPKDIKAENAVFEFRTRKAGEGVTDTSLERALNKAVRSQRMADANISESAVVELGKPIRFDARGLNEKGEEKDNTLVFAISFVMGLMIYITLAIYGQSVMGAVVEEKETRIAEILFSSARPFELLMGKLVGVGLAGLTQLAIWLGTASIFVGILVAQLAQIGTDLGEIDITPLMIIYCLIFFLLGYFIYSSIYALIGSMVTSMQEGGQFAFPPVMIMLIGFYMSFAVMRDPNSTLSFWVSIAPFFAPLTMPVRILAETPPFWQILLSIVINVAAIAGLVWVASRIYRVGMLMYGKRATVPELLKWIRQN